MPAGERQAAGEAMDPGGGGLWRCLLAGEKMIGELYQSEHITWDDAALTPAEKIAGLINRRVDRRFCSVPYPTI